MPQVVVADIKRLAISLETNFIYRSPRALNPFSESEF